MVSQAPRICVVIAAYNEAPVIASVVADVKRAGYRALVIDDGSTDATGAVAAEAGGSVVRHPINLGQGAGLQTGIEFALGSRILGTSLNQPRSRRMLLKAATLFTRLTTGLRVTDTHNGLRAMTRRGASSINLRQNRMAHASEILFQIAASGLNYVEAPVRIEYSAYSLAKGQTLGDTLMIVLDLFARRLHR